MSGQSVDAKLAVNKYFVDDANAHIALAQAPDQAVFDLLIKVCPAGLYRRDESGACQYDYAGCLECGACRLLGYGTALEKWEYPQGSMGVEYRFG